MRIDLSLGKAFGQDTISIGLSLDSPINSTFNGYDQVCKFDNDNE